MNGGQAMNLNPAELVDPVFNFLDTLIQNYGVYLYLVFVWPALLVIAWIFSGGLRRKRPGKLLRIRPRHHHYDATDEPTATANHRHRS